MRAPPLRYTVLGAVTLLLVGHFIGRQVSESYAYHSSIKDLKQHAGLSSDYSIVSTWSNGKLALHGGDVGEHHHYAKPDPATNTTRTNSAFVMVSCSLAGRTVARSAAR
jgi:hypothetical protein